MSGGLKDFSWAPPLSGAGMLSKEAGRGGRMVELNRVIHHAAPDGNRKGAVRCSGPGGAGRGGDIAPAIPPNISPNSQATQYLPPAMEGSGGLGERRRVGAPGRRPQGLMGGSLPWGREGETENSADQAYLEMLIWTKEEPAPPGRGRAQLGLEPAGLGKGRLPPKPALGKGERDTDPGEDLRKAVHPAEPRQPPSPTSGEKAGGSPVPHLLAGPWH